MTPKDLTLEETMRLAFNAGMDVPSDSQFGRWDEWWKKEGRERHDRFLEGSAEGDRTVDG